MIGRKIRYYRLKSGLTCEELASKVGVTKTLISLYETGQREPNEESSKKIADALGVSWIKLLSRESDNLKFNHYSFRKKQKASKTNIEILKEEIESKCADRISLLNILGISKNVTLKIKKLSFEEDVETNARKIRESLKVNLSGPISSVVDVLEYQGAIVLSFPCSDEIDGLNGTVNDIPYIFFNSNRTIERQRFTMIHEVCHLFFKDSTTTLNEKEIEKYINEVAGHVLVPTNDIYEIFGRKNRNISIYLREQIAKEYGVAVSCLVTRLCDAGIVTQMYKKNYFVNLNKMGGKRFEKSLLDEKYNSEEPTFFNQQVYIALSDELITASRAAEFLHVPLVEVMQNMRIE